jgi:hypothetical protein
MCGSHKSLAKKIEATKCGKMAKISVYDRLAIVMMKFGNSKVWQESNTYQNAKVWLGKLWLGTKHTQVDTVSP